MSSSEYQIIEEIGSGSYSQVYKVIHLTSNAYFAMKKIDISKLTIKQKQYTATEVKILKQITHPHIIKFEKSFQEGNHLYIILELAKGGNLQSKLNVMKQNNEKFELITIWKYTYQIISGLSILHQHNIAHRDIKASNILIMNENTLKIGDFNIGKVIENEILYTQIGTPAMMSPEIWNGEPYDLKTDIWSLGCVVYQLATLKPPFIAQNLPSLYSKIVNCQYEKVKKYPARFNKLLKSLLEKDPNLRPSCEDLLKLKCFSAYKSKSFCENVRKNSFFSECYRQKTGKNWFSGKKERKIEALSGDSMVNLRKKALKSENESFNFVSKRDSSPQRARLTPSDEYCLGINEYLYKKKGVEGVMRNKSLRVLETRTKSFVKKSLESRKFYAYRRGESRLGSRKLSPSGLENISDYIPRSFAKRRENSRKSFINLSPSPKPQKVA